MAALRHRQGIITTEIETNQSKRAVSSKIKVAKVTGKRLEEEIEEDNVEYKTRDDKARAVLPRQIKAFESGGKLAVQHDADELNGYERGVGAAAKAALDDAPENRFDVVDDSGQEARSTASVWNYCSLLGKKK
jgi:hypothetical protein